MTASSVEPQRDRPVLVVEGLSKRYGWKTALDGVSFAVDPGECLLILGPNGAGKTTLLRLLAGLLRPTAGTISWFGLVGMGVPLGIRRQLGVVMHRTMLDPELTVAENLRYYARLYRVADVPRRLQEVVELVGIGDRLQERVRQLSRGLQQRVALARALLHGPAVLLLDEPDTGLDQVSRRRLVAVLEQHRASGGTVLLTTHAHEFGLEVATRALYLERGRIVWSSTDAGDLRQRLGKLAALVVST